MGCINKKTNLLGWFRPDFRDDVERHCVCVCRAKINLQIPTYTYGVKYVFAVYGSGMSLFGTGCPFTKVLFEILKKKFQKVHVFQKHDP